jgi:hypothetical protein
VRQQATAGCSVSVPWDQAPLEQLLSYPQHTVGKRSWGRATRPPGSTRTPRSPTGRMPPSQRRAVEGGRSSHRYAHGRDADPPTLTIWRDRRLDSPELSPSDRALLGFAADAVQRPRMRDEVFEQGHKFLTERELVEVLQVVGYYWSFGRISTVLDVEVTKVYSDEPVLDTPDDNT